MGIHTLDIYTRNTLVVSMKHGKTLRAMARYLYRNGPTTCSELRDFVNGHFRCLSVNSYNVKNLLQQHFIITGTTHKRYPGSGPMQVKLWGLKDYDLLTKRYRGKYPMFKHGKVSDNRNGNTTVWCTKYDSRWSWTYCVEQCQECEGTC